jgi:hypothetical protein
LSQQHLQSVCWPVWRVINVSILRAVMFSSCQRSILSFNWEKHEQIWTSRLIFCLYISTQVTNLQTSRLRNKHGKRNNHFPFQCQDSNLILSRPQVSEPTTWPHWLLLETSLWLAFKYLFLNFISVSGFKQFSFFDKIIGNLANFTYLSDFPFLLNKKCFKNFSIFVGYGYIYRKRIPKILSYRYQQQIFSKIFAKDGEITNFFTFYILFTIGLELGSFTCIIRKLGAT